MRIAAYALLGAFSLYGSLQVTLALFGVDPDALHTYMLWTGVQAHGLGWLKDWIYTQDNWLLSLAPLHFIAFATLGPHLATSIYAGWAIFVASAVAAGAVVWRLGQGAVAIPLVLCLLNLGLYAHEFGLASYANSHNATNLFGLVALAFLAAWLQRPRFWLLLPIALLLVCGGVSDPWMVAAYDLPIALVAALFAALPPEGVSRRDALMLLLVAALSILAVRTRLFGVFGFLPQMYFGVADVQTIVANVLFVIKDLGGLLNLVPFTTGNALVPGLISCVLVFVLLGLVVLWPVRPARPAGAQLGLLLVCLLSIGGTTAAMSLSDVPAEIISGRYVINALYLTVVLLFWLCAAKWRGLPRAIRVLAIGVLALFLAAAAVGDARHWTRPTLAAKEVGLTRMAAFLNANGLTYGYGPYWGTLANAVSAASGFRTIIRPVSFGADTGMMFAGLRSQTSRRWFQQAEAPAGLKEYFVIVKADGEECPDPQLCIAGLQRQFGPPSRTLRYEDADILVWPHPLLGVEAPPIPIAMNQTLRVAADGVHPGGVGWSAPEAAGVWTDSAKARFTLRAPADLPADLDLIVTALADLSDKRPHRTVQVLVNGQPVGELVYDRDDNLSSQALRIPQALLRSRQGLLAVEFRIDRPISQLELGLSNDPRRLGIRLQALALRPAGQWSQPTAIGLNQTLVFKAGSAEPRGRGWSPPEPWGIWTRGDRAILRLQAPADPSGDLDLVFTGRAFLAGKHRRQTVAVAVNGQDVGKLEYDVKNSSGRRSVRLPAAVLHGAKGALNIELKIAKPMSPAELGLSADARRLGFGLESLSLQAAR